MKGTINGHGWLIAAALVGALTLTAACGGDSDSDASPGDGARIAGQGSTNSGGDSDKFGSRDDAFVPFEGSSEAAPSGVAAGTQDNSGGALLPALLDRKLIRTATIQIETGQVSQKFEDVANIAVSSGGLVFSSSFGNDGEQQNASITIRVPNDRYESVLAQLRRLGDVRAEQSNASDVTEEFTDLQSNLTNLLATEREYLKLLTQAQTIDEILTVQDRINSTGGQIEQVQGRLNLLGNQTDLATITAHLTPVIAKPADDTASSPLEVASEAFEASLAVLVGIAIVLIAIAAFSWWLLPLAAIGIYLGRRQMKQDRGRNQTPPPATAP
jgi:uncharacterized protein DUF4349